MSKSLKNFWLDVFILASLLITTITGFLLWLVISHELDIFYLGFARNVWVAAHIATGFAGIAAVVIPIVWHWAWLKALRDRKLKSLPKKLRANRIVNRVIWITFIATNVSGVAAWVQHFGTERYIVGLADCLHVVTGVAWTVFAVLHLALHWKWIISTTRRLLPDFPSWNAKLNLGGR
jgi:hypothetical protein